MPFPPHVHLPAWRGAAYALAAAILFGVSTPAIQRAGSGAGAFAIAALLYAGAAVVGAATSRAAVYEARVRRADLPRIAAMALAGAVIGPVALAFGLQRTSATAASLLLTMEAVFTAVLAFVVYRETIDRRIALALAATTGGGCAVVVGGLDAGPSHAIGLAAVVVATLAWAVDNTISRGVADRDTGRVVAIKAAIGATATGAIAFVAHEPWPSIGAATALVAIGASGYGLSLVCYLRAQRAFGASRTASVFAVGPFVGAVVAYAWTGADGGAGLAVGGGLMLVGLWLHATERHAHVHDHVTLEHEHAHDHRDGHHDHRHDPMPDGPHSHPHAHRPMRHAHPHVPDAHHLHPHGAHAHHEHEH